MKKRKLILGIALIIITFSILFIIIFPSIYSNNSAGRFEKQVEVDFKFLKNEKKPIVLVFFGYVGCTNICEPALKEISKIYNKTDQDKTSFYFVNLLSDVIPESVDDYVKAFNQKFNGVYLNPKEIDDITSKLNVLYIPSMLDKNVIDHSGFLYLFTNENGIYKQKYIYTTSPFDIEYISNDINKIQGELK